MSLTLTVENGCFAYSKGRPVLKDLNFTARSGELLAILGPNGAGKTTLLRCITGLLHWTSGQTLLDGQPASSLSSRRLWQRIAYVPQAKGTFAAYTAEEMILLGCTNQLGLFSAPGARELERVHGLMEQLSISALAKKKCTEISGGELQMVLIARALAAEPELLILDEPESNLDFKNQLIVLDTMSALAKAGLCCIFNTHYPAHALTRAGKSLLLCKGGEALFGGTEQVISEENMARAFGVRTVIGEIETPEQIYRDILPLHILSDPPEKTAPELSGSEKRRIAVIGVIASDFTAGERINALLHEYNDCLIGRMGMPYTAAGVYIINVTLDGTEKKIRALAHQLSVLPGVSVKTTFAGEENSR